MAGWRGSSTGLHDLGAAEARALEPWCAEQLDALGKPTSYLCYSAGDDPGMQYLALCEDSGGEVTATKVIPCGPGPDACKVGDNANDSCNPWAADCAVLAQAALTIDSCPPLAGDTAGSAAHKLRCTAATNQVFVGDNHDTGECEVKGDDRLTREQQVKTVLAATFGAKFMEGVNHYLATNEACKQRDFSEFKDLDKWAGGWSASVLKFAICVEILEGRKVEGEFVIAPRAQVLEGEMTAMLARAGGVAPLALADNTALAPHANVVALHQRHEELEMGEPKLRELVNLHCPADAWFFKDPVLQAAVDQGLTCDPHPMASMTRTQTAEWLHRRIPYVVDSPAGSEPTLDIATPAAKRPRVPESASPENELALCVAIRGAVDGGDNVRALGLIARHKRLFSGRGQLEQERMASEVEALCGLGRVAAARRVADGMLALWPDSPLGRSVRAGCAFH